jgi:alpha-beta hydrolase superfamily lysophospholipase
MTTEEATLTDPDGVEVFYRRWMPDVPRAIVLVLHGMSEHSGRYDRFAEALAGDGCAVYALDHRGHGRTAGSTGVGRTGPNGFDGVLGSVRALHERARADLGDLPLVVFGHSMGSMITQAYVQRHGDHAGFILSGTSGPNPALGEMAAGLQMVVDAGGGDDVLPLLSGFNEAFEPSRTPYDWLSRDGAEVDRYLADPYCGDEFGMTAGFVAGLLGMLAEASAPRAIESIAVGTPVLLVTGGADPVSEGGETVRALEAAYRDAGLAVTAHYYADARHEVLNETNRDEVTDDIRSWLSEVLG